MKNPKPLAPAPMDQTNPKRSAYVARAVSFTEDDIMYLGHRIIFQVDRWWHTDGLMIGQAATLADCKRAIDIIEKRV